MIVVIDNYDSFTFNLVQAFGVLGAEVRVFRNDAVDVAGVAELEPDGIVLSPGPGRPEDAGCCLDLVRELGGRVPLLGVCLGHQAIGAVFGARIVRAPEVVHGKVAEVSHRGAGLYESLPSPLSAARYHSLIVEREGLPVDLVVDAEADGGLIMGMRHRSYPLYGVQFHPESVATPEGPALLGNFLALAALTGDRDARSGGAPC